MEQHALNRRSFITGAAAGAAAIAAAAAVPAATQARADEAAVDAKAAYPAWLGEPPVIADDQIAQTVEVDVVVVGGGGAGFSAGIEAADAGCSVLVLEKGGVCGGNSYMCGGHVMCAGSTFQKEFQGVEGDTQEKLDSIHNDSGEQFAEDMIRWAQGLSNDDMIREMCVKSGETVDWLMSLGREFNTVEYIAPIWQFDNGHDIHARCLVNDTPTMAGTSPILNPPFSPMGTTW